MGEGEGEPAAAGQSVVKPEEAKEWVGQARGKGKREEEREEEGEEGGRKYEKGQGQGEII
jgi:hypothetical protein